MLHRIQLTMHVTWTKDASSMDLPHCVEIAFLASLACLLHGKAKLTRPAEKRKRKAKLGANGSRNNISFLGILFLEKLFS